MKPLVHKDRLTDTGCTIVNNLIKTPIPCVSYVVETDLVYFNNVVIGQGGYIPGPDTGDTPDTGSTPDTGDTPDTGSTPDTGDTPDTGSTPDTGETPDTGSVESKCLTFVALESGNFGFYGSNSSNMLNYSLDNGVTWQNISRDISGITVNAGDKVMWKGSGLRINGDSGIGRFTSNCRFNIEGDIVSLLNGGDFDAETILVKQQFARLFTASTVASAEFLILPAKVEEKCYYQMFSKCTSLTKAPELPSETLTKDCYRGMFSGCTSLNEIKCFATTNIGEEDSTKNWVKGVGTSGTFYKSRNVDSEHPWIIGGNDGDGIPDGWGVEFLPDGQ